MKAADVYVGSVYVLRGKDGGRLAVRVIRRTRTGRFRGRDVVSGIELPRTFGVEDLEPVGAEALSSSKVSVDKDVKET